MSEDHDAVNDFDFVLAHQLEHLNLTGNAFASSVSATAERTPGCVSSSSGEVVAYLRDALVSHIAQNHGETQSYCDRQHVVDPNCVGIGEDTLVDMLMWIRSLANPTMSASEVSHDALVETDEEKEARIRERRMERMSRLWHDRIKPSYDQRKQSFYYPIDDANGESSQNPVIDLLNPLEQFQHNLLLRRTARLVQTQTRKRLVKRLHALLNNKTLIDSSVDKDMVVEAFGLITQL